MTRGSVVSVERWGPRPTPKRWSVRRPRLLLSERAISSLALRAINTSGARPWLVVEHTKILVAYVVVLRSPLTHSYLIWFIRSNERAILVRLHREVASSDTRCSYCKLVVLVTLGGFHLLDGLVACDSVEARKEIVQCFEEEIVRGTVLTPRYREEQL